MHGSSSWLPAPTAATNLAASLHASSMQPHATAIATAITIAITIAKRPQLPTCREAECYRRPGLRQSVTVLREAECYRRPGLGCRQALACHVSGGVRCCM
jgi:hypothetical protein